jgi:hypothetical protein
MLAKTREPARVSAFLSLAVEIGGCGQSAGPAAPDTGARTAVMLPEGFGAGQR